MGEPRALRGERWHARGASATWQDDLVVLRSLTEAGRANGLPKIAGKLLQGRWEACFDIRQALCCTLEELVPREHDCQGLTVLVDTRGQGAKWFKHQSNIANVIWKLATS